MFANLRRVLKPVAECMLKPKSVRQLGAVALVAAPLVAAPLLWSPSVGCQGKTKEEVATKGVFDSSAGFGKKAAVLVIDFCNAYTTPGSPFYCPDPEVGVVRAVEQSVQVVELARAKNVPVIYTRVLYNKNGSDGGVFMKKVPLLRQWVEGNPATFIVDQLKPHEDDTIVIKQYPSAFFGTSLAAQLTAEGVDTIILIGCSTSGCIRASCLDGMQHGFRMIVPRECVGDRHPAVHESNLFDMNAKNGDVVPRTEVLEYLAAL